MRYAWQKVRDSGCAKLRAHKKGKGSSGVNAHINRSFLNSVLLASAREVLWNDAGIVPKRLGRVKILFLRVWENGHACYSADNFDVSLHFQ